MEHQWTAAQIDLLSSLSINALPGSKDESNRFVGNQSAIDFGRKLFFDPRFSQNETISCSSCHQVDKHFTDGRATAKGLVETSRNAPTIVGASEHTWFFHDGRSDSLWSQATGPLENPLEHGGNRIQYALIVFNDNSLRKQYEEIFGLMPDISDNVRFPLMRVSVDDAAYKKHWKAMSLQDRVSITQIFVNMAKSIAAYETTLQPTTSRFDQYVNSLVKGEFDKAVSVYSSDEAAGLKLFIGKANCFICHNSPLFSDREFHNVNTPPRKGFDFDWGRYSGAQQVLKSEFNCRSEYNDAANKNCEELTYITTEKDETIGSMKTPGLRDVSKTGPYMHAGQYKTLAEVIEHYNDPPPLTYRVTDLFDIDLSKKEAEQLEKFLLSLDSIK
ncbi:MAG: hypothetical protein OEZ43_15420 [Gammaproteobacteria bacterium]|nr:hypothetical protein [Gammaproteobacteria bacterium]